MRPPSHLIRQTTAQRIVCGLDRTTVCCCGVFSRTWLTVVRWWRCGSIGGITPGSMPPFSTSVEEEGVLFDNFKLVSRGHFMEAELRAVLASGAHPSRNIDNNVSDLKGQLAACEKGIQELRRMVEHFGLEVVQAYMGHVQDNAEESVRRVLDVLQPGTFTCPLDDGVSRIQVAISIDKASRSATVDFTGTSPQLPTNFNAPTACCRAAVLYVFRTLGVWGREREIERERDRERERGAAAAAHACHSVYLVLSIWLSC